ncbi:MAG: carboxypeptidase regulatory-like domain-containing protein [Myxococcota bacterium]
MRLACAQSIGWRVCPFFCLAPLVVTSAHCSESSDGTDATNSETGVINGRVIDAAGNRIADAELTSAGATVMTNEGGFFVIPELPKGRQLIKATKEGYALGGKTVTVVEGRSTYIEIRVLPFAAEKEIDKEAGGSVSVGDCEVKFPPGALVGSGPVMARLAVLRADDPDELQAFPGDFTTNLGGLLESFGAMAIEVSEMDGAPAELAQSAEVTMPVSNFEGDSIPLWRFDDETGTWTEEGELTGCGDGVCEGMVSELAWWNADQVMDTTCVNVCVEDTDGGSSPGIAVQAQGVDYAGISYATTGEDGCACLEVKRGGRAGLFGLSSNEVTDPVEVIASDAVAACGTDACQTLETPLVVEAPKFQATLEWGEEPSDLDSHLTGPCDPEDDSCTGRFRVFFGSQGSLSRPPWAFLDTDDTSSFGPEVITLSRCFQGTYRYAIHNFSGFPDLTMSDATTTILLPSGNVEFLTVPNSNPDADDVWVVGDLMCGGSACDCSWQPRGFFGPLNEETLNP